MKEIKFPTQYSYHLELAERGMTLIKKLEKEIRFAKSSQVEKGFEIMFSYFLDFPTSSLKDFNDYRKTILKEEDPTLKDIGTKEFIKEIYHLREKNFIFQNKEGLDYLD